MDLSATTLLPRSICPLASASRRFLLLSPIRLHARIDFLCLSAFVFTCMYVRGCVYLSSCACTELAQGTGSYGDGVVAGRHVMMSNRQRQ
jgi:hypothetical protein